MATLDSSIVNISLPVIAHDLKASLPATEWVVLSYMVGLAVLLIPVGRLSDIWGRRKTFVSGFLIFTLGSLLCGLAKSVEALIAMRLLQAIGAAGVLATGPAITTETFPHQRGKAFGLIGTVVSLGGMMGPAIGGWILEATHWAWIFWVNIPVGLIGSALAWRALSSMDIPQEDHGKFDVIGALLSVLSIGSLALLLTFGLLQSLFSLLNGVLLAVSVLCGLGFIWHELHTPSPLVYFPLFKRQMFTNAVMASFLSFIGITLLGFVMPFYLQVIRHTSPGMAGWLVMCTPLALAMVSPISGHWSDKHHGKNLATLGMAISAVALIALAFVGADTGFEWLVLAMLAIGFGNGLFHSPNSNLLLGSVPPEHLGLASGMLAIIRTLGMSFAIALAGIGFVFSHAHFAEAHGFMPAFKVVFAIAGGLTCVNVIWIGLFRPRS